MVYNSTYQTSDFKNILTDILGEAGAQILGYIGLIIIVFIIVFLISKLRGR